MPASSSATPSSANGRRPSRSGGSAKGTVILKLSSDLLSRFAPPPAEPKEKKGSKSSEARPESPVKEQPSSPASSAAEMPLPPSSVDNASDAASTPAAGTSNPDTPRRKGMPGPKPGSKRGPGTPNETYPRPRGKPGPKKKPRMDDGTFDAGKLVAAHKLGPKANTGAINAGLRALDRSGAPCRRWERKPLQLKSFTGVQWGLSSWRTPRPQPQENGESKEGMLETGDSDSKANQSASGVPSEKSNSGDGDLTPVPPNIAEPSSPAIAMTA
ncbi:DUF1711-domain-containing protein [Aspergillus campestris IBT 28561]|uniref:DUF1711-domain-containing protein n=1 Tax=Aspergillus campestris (strain IBT 28561) TaxID=1392248 RepID=A0A2I1CSM8_ASPC2|nr:DUF1711-domain-containing protein [Aspergillus campestris IBT 28561]PKY00624.1 DUF1711-domain-containing protein [Aspergillus campestris IBT 28561]